jgi:GTP1/Obg family GTP-binding protein
MTLFKKIWLWMCSNKNSVRIHIYVDNLITTNSHLLESATKLHNEIIESLNQFKTTYIEILENDVMSVDEKKRLLIEALDKYDAECDAKIKERDELIGRMSSILTEIRETLEFLEKKEKKELTVNEL